MNDKYELGIETAYRVIDNNLEKYVPVTKSADIPVTTSIELTGRQFDVLNKSAKELGVSLHSLLQWLIETQFQRINQFMKLYRLAENVEIAEEKIE